MRLEDMGDEFPINDKIAYLNHAAVSPWPRRTVEKIQAFAQENLLQGAKNYPQWQEQEMLLRQQSCELLNAVSVDDIGFLKNTSEALSVVAYGLPWQAGDNVIITDQEFPSNRIVWESLQDRGVHVKKAAIAQTPEEALFALVDERTRLISVSAVQYVTGLRMDLEKIGDFCQQHAILFCVDAIQSLGALQFDVQANQADFVMADGHKWMLAPEGLAIFYTKPQAREKLHLNEYGWHMVAHPHDFDAVDWQVAASGRRFECGSPNMLNIHALSASLSLLLEVGMANVEAQILDNSRYLFDVLSQSPDIELLTPQVNDRYAGIVTFRHRRKETLALLAVLKQQGVVCIPRGGGIRFSPHFYTSREHLVRAANLVLQ